MDLKKHVSSLIEKVFIEIESDKYDMEDLISRNVVLKILGERAVAHYEDWKAFKDYIGDRKEISKAKLKECSLISDIIAKLPVVEAVPVIYGEWKNMTEHNDHLHCKCSLCGFTTENYQAIKKWGVSSDDYLEYKWNFCPKCGTPMRKKVNEQNEISCC